MHYPECNEASTFCESKVGDDHRPTSIEQSTIRAKLLDINAERTPPYVIDWGTSRGISPRELMLTPPPITSEVCHVLKHALQRQGWTSLGFRRQIRSTASPEQFLASQD